MKDIIGERGSDDSEDDRGQPVYKRDRCESYKALQADLANERNKHEVRKQKIIKENRRLRDLGKKPIDVPGEFVVDPKIIERKVKEFAREFNRRQQ